MKFASSQASTGTAMCCWPPGCMFLTALSYFISLGTGFVEAPLARAFMRLSAIGVTTLLALRYQSAIQALRAQAALLDLTHDTVFVRDMDDVITYWNRAPRSNTVGRAKKLSAELPASSCRRTIPSLRKRFLPPCCAPAAGTANSFTPGATASRPSWRAGGR